MRDTGELAPAKDRVPVAIKLAVFVVPVNVGDADSTTEPDPVEVVTPVPPLATANVPEIADALVTDATEEDQAVAEEATKLIRPPTGMPIAAFVARLSIEDPDAGYTLIGFELRFTTINSRP